MSLVEDGTLELATTARSVLGRGPAARRRQRHRRAPARPPVGHRRLPRRGRGARRERVRAAGPGARARDDGGVPGRPRRTPDEVSARRAVLVLQRRLRRPGADRGTGEWDSLPRSCPRARDRAGWDGRHRVPPLGRAARPDRTGLPRGRRRVAHERPPPARARKRRRRRLHDGEGRRRPLACPLRRRDRPARPGRGDDAPAERRAAEAAVRPRLLAPRHERHGVAGGLRRRCLVLQRHDPHSGRGFAVLSNTSDGAWPAGRLLVEWLG